MTTATPAERLVAGTHVGPYGVLAFIDEGGMGEVYRARDTRLNRDVALKILPHRWSHDPKRRERFMREAQILSSLNHPHIAAIYDIGEHEGRTFLVMEYVDGEPLHARIAKRPFSAASVAALGSEMASALDAAHRRRFVHRDLKPANIMLTGSGVKLLDFGIAKLLSEPVNPVDQLEETTDSDAGAVPGTTSYSAPEQLDGRPVDPRADLFALGVVLFEMLTGHRPFRSASRAGVIAAILDKPPEPIGLPPGEVPPELERLILRCLEKDPDERWQSARDLSRELAWVAQDAERRTPIATTAAARRGLGVRALVVLAAALSVGSLGLYWLGRSQAALPPVFRFVVNLPADLVMAGTRAFVIAPDGRHLAFVGSAGGGPSLLWVQALDSYAPRPIRATDGAWHPFWSPDGRTVGFFAGTKLKTADIADGAVRTLAEIPDASRASQGTWVEDVLIVGSATSVYTVPAAGGAPAPLTLKQGEREVPAFALRPLPGGRRFLFRGPPAEPGGDNIYIASADDGVATPLMQADSQVDYVDPGYLLFMRGMDLLAQPFDPDTRRLSGTPAHVPEAVSRSTRLAAAILSVSRSGVLAYEADAVVTQLVWHDRVGRRLGTMGAPDLYTNPAVSADGSRVLVTRVDPSTGGTDIWLIEEERGSRALTAAPGTEDYAVWSPTGDSLIFASDRTGQMRMYEKPALTPADQTAAEVLVIPTVSSREDNWPMDWGASSRVLLFQGGGGGPGIPPLLFALSPRAERSEPFPVFPLRTWSAEIQTAAQPRLSPDERWIAYVADLGGSPQVHVRSLADGARAWQVSTTGGYEPKWRGDGRELFYLAPNRTVMAIDVRCTDSCTFGKPHSLFRVASLGAPLRKGSIRNEYDVTADGQRFLVNEPIDGVSAYSIRIAVNWLNQIKR